MPNQVKDLTSDQLRRIFRDYLKGVPKERTIKKYDLTEDTFWEIVGLYARKKHPNDVGNAESIKGPADLLVSPLDTGSKATEHPIVARNPKDLSVIRETEVKEFDFNSPEEELRKKSGEVADLVTARTAKEAQERQDEAREVIQENKEATDAIIEELAEASEEAKAEIAEKSVEAAKATPSAEELLKQNNERQESAHRAEREAEVERTKTLTERAQEAQDVQQESAGREAEARKRTSEHTGGKVPGGTGTANLGQSSASGTGSNQPSRAAEGVQPAKVEPDGLKGK